MSRFRLISILVPVLIVSSLCTFAGSQEAKKSTVKQKNDSSAGEYALSGSCRPCHERFYKLWAPSFHGTAMQDYTDEYAEANLTSQAKPIEIGGFSYQMDIARGRGWVEEKGAETTRVYKIKYVLGGKNVYYFLTPFDKGRLQTIPLAYDVRKKEWFDVAASGVRHIPGIIDEPVNWKERPYTFNSSCYGCHVSQLSTNYDFPSDTYRTTWAEPGINCETCHGPCAEHNRICEKATGGKLPTDLKVKVITQKKGYTAHQVDSTCAPCHAKMISLTAGFEPGDSFFDHYDLVTLEHQDFYPDGRDLGENYTYTTWLMSPCVKSGKLDCMHCHTSSGRYRHVDNPNQSCMPCHAKRVASVTEHSHHPADSPGSKCIACHMPMTEFARMRRSDHSMRPPAPAASVDFGSPNACNICHKKSDSAWADKVVRKRYRPDYQKPVLKLGGLLKDARQGNWKRLGEILAYLKKANHDEVYATSFVRLLTDCRDRRVNTALVDRLKNDFSPLVRSSAATVLGERLSEEAVDALLAATRDKYRLVRIRAAASLAPLNPELLPENLKSDLEKATAEFMTAMLSRSDLPMSHHDIGNYHMAGGRYQEAVEAFERAMRIDPANVPCLINVSLAYNALGQNGKAETSLRKALKLNPKNGAINLNLGLLLAELNRFDESEKSLRAAMKVLPDSAPAAYNLGMVLLSQNSSEGMTWLRKAYELAPESAKYAYTLAYYEREKGNPEKAVNILQEHLARGTSDVSVYSLLGETLLQLNRKGDAVKLYRSAALDETIPEQYRYGFAHQADLLADEQ